MKHIEINQSGSQYDNETRQRAVVEYLVLGNIQRVSDSLNIPRQTLSGWTKSEWWQSMLSEIRQEKQEEIDNGIQKALETALEGVQDRIENGDSVIGKEGDLIRKPMSGRDMTTSFGILFDKQRIIRNLPTSISGSADSDKLAKLQAQFEALANEKTVDGSVVSEQHPGDAGPDTPQATDK